MAVRRVFSFYSPDKNIDEQTIDRRATAQSEKVQAYPPGKAAAICSLEADLIRDVARRISAVKPMMLCYTLGITEHTCGRNNVLAVANLQMLLGNMGVECGGVNPLRGQNNVQGACDMGAFTNSERRVNRVRTARAAPGMAKPNWWIFKQIAKRLGHEWPADSARELWDNEISVLAPQLCGIKYARLEGDGLQWPCPDESHDGTCYLHKDGAFTCGLGVFNPVDWTPPAEEACEDYPLVLSTGRRLAHYHTRTQTGRCEDMNDILGEETVDMSPLDASALQIGPGETVRVVSRRGEVRVKAHVTERVPGGMVWMAFHFRETNANWLTNPVFDPVTITAEYKACAVRVEKL